MVNLKKKGFTIIELVIVIAVIAVLAAVLIPTFSNLVKKANMSADMQIVKNMNTVLAADEVIDGKPATVVEAKEVLTNNGISTFTAHDSDNEYYWLGGDNRVLLWEKSKSDDTKGKVIYPEEYKKMYGDIEEVSSSWSLLSSNYEVKNVIPKDDDDDALKTALLKAVKEASNGTIIKLPENSNLNLAKGGLYWLGEAIIYENSGQGKTITIDLNGSIISSEGTDAKYVENEDGSYATYVDSNGDTQNYLNILTVPVHGELILANGTINANHANIPTTALLSADSGSRLVVRNMNINTNTSGVYPHGDASEVVVENSKITSAYFPVGTNRMESSNIRITISNSELSTENTGVLINTPSYTRIYNSTITGGVQALIVRAGTIDIENSKLITTDTEPGDFSYDDFACKYQGFNGWWKSGNTLPGATLVLGDYAKANNDGSFSFSGNVTCNLVNVEIKSADSNKIPNVLMAASDPAKIVSLTYDTNSTIGELKKYGEVWNPTQWNVGISISNTGTLKVNGENK